MRLVNWLMFPVVAALMVMLLPAKAADATWTLKLASVAPEGSPWAEGLTNFKSKVESATHNRLNVRLFIGGTLGDENETVLQCQRGQIQGVGASTGALASLVPELSVLELPFLFKDGKEADQILDKVILNSAESAFAAKGFKLGFWSENGFRSFGTQFGFVKSPADLKGRKMRSQENPVHIAMYQAFGASPNPIPTTEVLTALNTGVVEGYDNTPLFAFAAQWTSGTKYFTITRHIYQPAAIVFNKGWYDGLPDDVKGVLATARAELTQPLRDQIRAMEPILVQNMASMHVQVYTPTATELSSFQAAAKTARDNYMSGKASSGEKALYGQITAGIAEWRKSH